MQIFLNEKLIEEFQPTRDVQQGNPLLSYLFVLCMEGLPQAISFAVRIRGIISNILVLRIQVNRYYSGLNVIKSTKYQFKSS